MENGYILLIIIACLLLLWRVLDDVYCDYENKRYHDEMLKIVAEKENWI